MTTSSQTIRAAHNNALWCDAVCRVHGLQTELSESYWFCREKPPRFYPNLVTRLEGRAFSSLQVARIQQLMSELGDSGWGVKDSFDTLALSPLGFRREFEATWIWRAAGNNIAKVENGVRWSSISDSALLRRWEQRWSVSCGLESCSGVFRDAIIHESGVRIFAATREGEVVGGAVANQTDDVVGLSNVFAPRGEELEFWRGCVAAVGASFPGLPLVGYQREEGLVFAKEVGFESLRTLSIWILP